MDKLEELSKEIKNFVDERDWNQFHSPANLSKSISIEANELLECFQWDETNYNLDDVTIYISYDCIDNYDLARFQIAHEVIHTLYTNKQENTTNLEEGLAVFFQLKESPTIGIEDGANEYRNACELVTQLINDNPQIIKQAREIEPNISKISTDLLLQLKSNIDLKQLNELTQIFPKYLPH